MRALHRQAACSTDATHIAEQRLVAAECAEVYGQCGGQAWRGPTCCLPGSACVIEEAAVAGSYGEGSVGGAYAFAGGAYSRCLPEPFADPITGMLAMTDVESMTAYVSVWT